MSRSRYHRANALWALAVVACSPVLSQDYYDTQGVTVLRVVRRNPVEEGATVHLLASVLTGEGEFSRVNVSGFDTSRVRVERRDEVFEVVYDGGSENVSVSGRFPELERLFLEGPLGADVSDAGKIRELVCSRRAGTLMSISEPGTLRIDARVCGVNLETSSAGLRIDAQSRDGFLRFGRVESLNLTMSGSELVSANIDGEGRIDMVNSTAQICPRSSLVVRARDSSSLEYTCDPTSLDVDLDATSRVSPL